jgi:hypothetical protein
LSPKSETLYEEENRGDIDGVGPSCTRVVEEPGNLRRGKDSPEREAAKHILELE